MPKVSVIIPAYNAMQYLPQTVVSVLEQTYQDWELIVINDGSTDAIESWFTTIDNSKIELISQENKGVSAARNRGLVKASGEYIAFLDADDLWAANKLARQVKVLDKNPHVGLVYTSINRIDEAGKSIGKPFICNLSGHIWSQLLSGNIIAPSSTMVRRCCFDKVGLFDEDLKSFSEDWDLWLRIAACYPIGVLPEPLAYYRECPTSVSKNWSAMEWSYSLVIEKAFAAASPEIMSRKGRSYGRAYLHLASQSLKSQKPDSEIASNYLLQAMKYDPQLKLSKEYFRLKLTVWSIQWLGIDSYNLLHGKFRLFRNYLFWKAQ